MRKLATIFFLTISLSANAEVTEKISYTYYPANAAHTQSLKKVLDDASPHREGTQVFYGMTDWAVNWRFEGTESSAGNCRITKVTTELSVAIDLPRLIGGTAAQTDQFNKLLPALRSHELGHYSIARQAAAAIDSKIRSLPEMPNCKSLYSAANDVGSQTLDDFKAREIQYDVVTSHGATQEAWQEE
jgi:predicted secreted Zn-dependent protease